MKFVFGGRWVNHNGWFSYANSPYLRVNQSAVTNTAENDAYAKITAIWKK
jgi:hypothetical protein